MNNDYIVEMKNIRKEFPGVIALDDVDFEVTKGEIHALVGENGAGKSTLMNILGGILQPNAGTIIINGKEVNLSSPKEAQKAGISFIHQELALFPQRPVVANIFIESLPNSYGLVSWKKLNNKASKVLKKINLDISSQTTVSKLRMGERQMVEIARSLIHDTKILVLDEPTSSLTEKETETLFALMKNLTEQGVSIIYISHRMEEIFEICDRVTVLRDGKKIKTSVINDIEPRDLIHSMVGRELDEYYPKDNKPFSQILISIENFNRDGEFEDINFDVKAGEIIGITGLMGSGRTELARAIFGLDQVKTGTIKIKGKKVEINSPEDAIKYNFGFVTENRREEGLVINKSIKDNIVMASLEKFINCFGWVDKKAQYDSANNQIKSLNVITPSEKQRVKLLSGGNQQKVVVGKWLETDPDFLILDEPTRGIDVGAKAEIYELISDLAKQGKGIVLISSELPEILGMSDRILVMRKGKIVQEFSAGEANQHNVLEAATGGASK